MKRNVFNALFMLLSLVVAAEASAQEPYYPATEWRTSPAEKQNMNGLYLDRMHERFDRQGKIVIIRNGYLIDSRKPIDLSAFEHIHSCTKSVISLLFGTIFEEEAVNGLVVDYFPDHRRADNEDVSVFHLLTMTSGMDWSDNPNIDSRQLPYEANWVEYILAKKIVAKPGSRWSYNSGGSQLLSVMMQNRLNYPLRQYVEERLFKPLSIGEYEWWNSNDGFLTAGWGLHLRVFDLTKLGYLMLRKGQWNGKVVVKGRWIEEATSGKVKVNGDYSYGYQWWVYDSLRYRAYKAYGSYGDHSVMVILIPELDVEVVLAGNFRNDIEILRDYVIPSIEDKPF